MNLFSVTSRTVSPARLPRADAIFAKQQSSISCILAGRITFMKVNGSHAYQSIPLESQTRPSR
ncbi:hypothetical protein ALQ58_101506 [Pseudomonas syringae pv. apii]|uniref:Uncharacterized protein n=1 Tax=Pseudomonas syringae pv. apii TaxID=81036 RepID=A0A3M3R749_9PSED|nr:hypothetical protein ALQ58_101506 [Pseudomonas syringae pv. apii]RMN92329.1 hypothetical protein ALQ49_101250 [Pseudomonas syringae pv. apii]